MHFPLLTLSSEGLASRWRELQGRPSLPEPRLGGHSPVPSTGRSLRVDRGETLVWRAWPRCPHGVWQCPQERLGSGEGLKGRERPQADQLGPQGSTWCWEPGC